MDTNTTNETEAVIETSTDINEVISIGEWILTFIVLSIPVVNIVMAIIWLMSSKTKQTKKNFLIAMLVIWAATILLFFMLGASLSNLVPALG